MVSLSGADDEWSPVMTLCAADESAPTRARATRGHAEGGGRPLSLERLDPQILGAVDAEQHDDEEEQHDDRAGVDDDLHGREEVGVLGTNSTATPNSVITRLSAAVDGIAPQHHADRAHQNDRGGDDEDERRPSVAVRPSAWSPLSVDGLARRSVPPRAGRTP